MWAVRFDWQWEFGSRCCRSLKLKSQSDAEARLRCTKNMNHQHKSKPQPHQKQRNRRIDETDGTLVCIRFRSECTREPECQMLWKNWIKLEKCFCFLIFARWFWWFENPIVPPLQCAYETNVMAACECCAGADISLCLHCTYRSFSSLSPLALPYPPSIARSDFFIDTINFCNNQQLQRQPAHTI